MTPFSPFCYVPDPRGCLAKDAFVAVVPGGIDTKNALLDALATELAFPTYFGHNWDALFDCLRDLGWIDAKNIVLVHSELPKLTNSELSVYLQVLKDSVLDWRADNIHNFEVIFAESDRRIIEKFLRDYG